MLLLLYPSLTESDDRHIRPKCTSINPHIFLLQLVHLTAFYDVALFLLCHTLAFLQLFIASTFSILFLLYPVRCQNAMPDLYKTSICSAYRYQLV